MPSSEQLDELDSPHAPWNKDNISSPISFDSEILPKILSKHENPNKDVPINGLYET